MDPFASVIQQVLPALRAQIPGFANSPSLPMGGQSGLSANSYGVGQGGATDAAGNPISSAVTNYTNSFQPAAPSYTAPAINSGFGGNIDQGIQKVIQQANQNQSPSASTQQSGASTLNPNLPSSFPIPFGGGSIPLTAQMQSSLFGGGSAPTPSVVPYGQGGTAGALNILGAGTPYPGSVSSTSAAQPVSTTAPTTSTNAAGQTCSCS